jgi:hypothetical protein
LINASLEKFTGALVPSVPEMGTVLTSIVKILTNDESMLQNLYR